MDRKLESGIIYKIEDNDMVYWDDKWNNWKNIIVTSIRFY